MHRIRPLLIILIFLIFVNLKLLRWKTDCHTSLLRNELGLGVLAGVCRHLSLTLVTQLLLEILAQLFFSWSTRSLRLPLLRVNLMDWFYDLVIIDRPWEDSQVWFRDWYKSYIHWLFLHSMGWTNPWYINQLISPDHDVAQYIRGFKIHANTAWENVDFVCIPINLPEACHWVLVVITIKSRCIHVLD